MKGYTKTFEVKVDTEEDRVFVTISKEGKDILSCMYPDTTEGEREEESRLIKAIIDTYYMYEKYGYPNFRSLTEL